MRRPVEGNGWAKLAKRTLTERCEDIADEVLGKGSAISIDKVGRAYVARAWDKYGRMWTESEPAGKACALRQLLRRIGTLRSANTLCGAQDRERGPNP